MATSSSSSFYIILPSNTQVEGNRTNSFRVRLPRKLQFNSEWHVGLAVMVYPHSWPSLGTSEEQSVSVVWQTGDSIRLPVPQSSLANPNELLESLQSALRDGSEQLAQKVRTVQFDYGKMTTEMAEKAKREHERMNAEQIAKKDAMEKAEKGEEEARIEIKSEEDIFKELVLEEISKMDSESRQILEATKEMGMEAWVHAYRHAKFACHFQFDSVKNRFSIQLKKKFIQKIAMTDQLAYILGFDNAVICESQMAQFMPDLSGGVSSLHVYAPGLIEPMIVGDICAPVLRIVTIRGQKDEIVEEQFISIQYHKILVKEISELLIEIRTASGALMPFQYGTCTLTLHFRKLAYF